MNYIPETVRRGGTVLSCAPVDRIRFEGKRAVGVTGRFRHPLTRRKGQRFSVRAKTAVLVAASATRSPVLLRRSGVRLPALGRYFRAHPGSGIFGVYDDPVDMNRGATQGWASTALRNSDGIKLEVLSLPPELVASRLAGAGPALMERLRDYRHMAMWCLSVRAESTGRVYAGPFGTPIVRYQMNRRDMALLREGAWHVARLHVAAGAKRVVPGIFGLPYSLDANDVDKIRTASINPQAWTAILSHLFGGCVMGADPRRSVCDPTGAVRGRKALYVVDASALPTTLGVNPQHTIMAMARIQAERMLDKNRRMPRQTGKVISIRSKLSA
ncbi:MAG: choline dehydrogenase-like flavoprotein [Myxococcota bacterium]